MNLQEIRLEILEALEKRRKEIQLSFIEEKHLYWMSDTKGKVKKFPSVSKIIGKFYEPFDANKKALEMSGGDMFKQRELLLEWKAAADYSTNMGSRVHYLLESDIIKEYGNYKEVRQPIFKCDETQIEKGDNMFKAGKDFLNLMHERGAVLLDTEMVLGDNELEYVGQPDNSWIMLNKDKTDFGLVITDHKTNQPKNFIVQPYNGKLFDPFNSYRDYALTHYFLQIPLYGKLLLKMLAGTKFADKKFLGGVVVLLKEDGTFEEYKVPGDITKTILNMDISKYIK